MKNTTRFKRISRALLFAASVSLLLPGAFVVESTAKASEPKVIRVAPPAPVFDDAERRAELSARRSRVAESIGPNGVLILFSAEPRIYTNDVDFEFRQENNHFYLTHLNQQNSILVIVPGSEGPREILFLPRRNPARETWDGYMYSAEDARRISGVDEIWDVSEFEPFVKALREKREYRPASEAVLLSKDGATRGPLFKRLHDAAEKKEAALYLLVPAREVESGEFGEHREWRQEQKFAREWMKESKGVSVRSAFPIFSAMRLRKSPSELRILQHAIDITIEALGRAMAVAPRSQWEYEVEAEVDYTFRRRNADNWGYPSIVGCGPNATTLHYNASQGRVTPGQLILMDVGAEYMHYTADVTRTFPINGKFTKEQADIYNLVLAAQEAGMRAIKPGSTRGEVHNAAVEVIKDGLFKLGLITERDGTIDIGGQTVPQYRLWFMHGTTHWLGMNVHDVGGGASEKLEPGMVFTNEPGVYIREDALDYLPKNAASEKFKAAVGKAFEKYKNIGVRIEDDMLVTADGYKNMSVALPRTIPDIEAFMAKARKEVRAGAVKTDGPRRGHVFVGSPMEFARHAHLHGDE